MNKRILIVMLIALAAASCASTTATADKKLSPSDYAKIARDAARDAFVKIEVSVKRNDDPEGTSMDYEMKSHFRKKRTLNMWGVLVGDGSLVATSDPGVEALYYDAVTVTTADGKAYGAELHGFLKSARGILFKLKDGVALKGLRFRDFTADDISRIYPASVSQTPEIEFFVSIKSDKFFGSPFFEGGVRQYTWLSKNTIIFDSKARPVGMCFGRAITYEKGGENKGWRGTYLFSDENIVTCEAFAEFSKKVKKGFFSRFRRIEIAFRQEKERSGSYYRSSSQSGRDNKKHTYFGLVIAPDKLLVPFWLKQGLAKRIESVRVFDGGNVLDGVFMGQYKTFGAFVIQAKGMTAKRAADLSATGAIRLGQTYLAASLDYRQGRRKELIKYFRIDSRRRGYKNILSVSPSKELKPGAFVLDLEGNLLGFYVKEFYEDRIKTAGSSYRYSEGMSELSPRIYSFQSVKERFVRYAEYFDPQVKPVSKQEEKKLVWLGVEYQEIGKNLAELLKVRKITKDGKLGLLVSLVYKNSPAEKLGLVPGDILLKLKKKGSANIKELKAGGSGGSYYYRRYRRTVAKNRKNYLTALLTGIGKGEQVELTVYLHKGKKERKLTMTLEEAPPDYESAKKYKNEDIGLTVKNITYEVRRVMNLAGDFKGVIVSKIEPGTPAAVGRIYPGQFVVKVGDAPVEDVKEFEKMIGNAKKGGKKTVTLQVMFLGKTRFIDIKL